MKVFGKPLLPGAAMLEAALSTKDNLLFGMESNDSYKVLLANVGMLSPLLISTKTILQCEVAHTKVGSSITILSLAETRTIGSMKHLHGFFATVGGAILNTPGLSVAPIEFQIGKTPFYTLAMVVSVLS